MRNGTRDLGRDARRGEADLGSGLIKKRIARSGGGKSGGYRVIVAYRPPRTERVLFTYAFAKNAASTLTPQGHEALAKVAKAFVEAGDEQVARLLASQDVSEVTCNGDQEGETREAHGPAGRRG